MAIRIPIELKRIVDTNKQIIHSLKVQKARQDQMLDKYEATLKEELEIPSNRFLPIYKNVVPFLDHVISSKLMDFELLKRVEAFSNELIRYNADFIISEEQIAELEDGFDQLVDNMLELEERFSRLSEENKRLKSQIFEGPKDPPMITNIPKTQPVSKCVYCEGLLHTKEELLEGICKDCSSENEEESQTEEDQEDEPEEDEPANEEYKPKEEDEEPVPEVKPEVRKGFQNLMKDFDRKYRQKIEEEKAKEKEKMDYLDGV